MLRNIFLVSLLIYAVCAAQWEISEVDSEEDQDEEISADGMPKQQMSIKCNICKAIIEAVKKKIPSNATQDKIKTLLNNICDQFKPMSGPCKDIVEKHLRNLISELMTNDGPNAICIKIHACKKATTIK